MQPDPAPYVCHRGKVQNTVSGRLYDAEHAFQLLTCKRKTLKLLREEGCSEDVCHRWERECNALWSALAEIALCRAGLDADSIQLDGVRIELFRLVDDLPSLELVGGR